MTVVKMIAMSLRRQEGQGQHRGHDMIGVVMTTYNKLYLSYVLANNKDFYRDRKFSYSAQFFIMMCIYRYQLILHSRCSLSRNVCHLLLNRVKKQALFIFLVLHGKYSTHPMKKSLNECCITSYPTQIDTVCK